ncbi:PR-1-like protein [Xylariaceae sp. FL0016]|nr:PR-1-like protein [Xylariaceae sp. FL0016]
MVPPSPSTLLPSALLFLLLHLLSSTQVSAQTVVVTVGPTIPSEAPSFVDEDTFTSAILNSTNTYRTAYNASSVRWNDTLEAYASDYLNSTCDFAHSGGPYGENLAIGCANASSCVEAWGNEAEDYSFKNPGFKEKTGHFSQLVWKDTTDVGCGRRICGDQGWYLACEYWPRGNVIGAFEDEVDKPVNGVSSLAPNRFHLVMGLLMIAGWQGHSGAVL